LRSTHENETTLVVSHAAVNPIHLSQTLHLPDDSFFRIAQAHAAINYADYFSDFALMRRINLHRFTSHPGS